MHDSVKKPRHKMPSAAKRARSQRGRSPRPSLRLRPRPLIHPPQDRGHPADHPPRTDPSAAGFPAGPDRAQEISMKRARHTSEQLINKARRTDAMTSSRRSNTLGARFAGESPASGLLQGVVHCAPEVQLGISGNCAAYPDPPRGSPNDSSAPLRSRCFGRRRLGKHDPRQLCTAAHTQLAIETSRERRDGGQGDPEHLCDLRP